MSVLPKNPIYNLYLQKSQGRAAASSDVKHTPYLLRRPVETVRKRSPRHPGDRTRIRSIRSQAARTMLQIRSKTLLRRRGRRMISKRIIPRPIPTPLPQSNRRTRRKIRSPPRIHISQLNILRDPLRSSPPTANLSCEIAKTLFIAINVLVFAPPLWSLHDTQFCICDFASHTTLFDKDFIFIFVQEAPDVEDYDDEE